MIECIFTLDYEIYGNGEGSLRQLVFEPCRQLMGIFENFNKRFVVFVEAAELEKIQEFQSDDTIDKIRYQIQELYRQGFEIGLHLHSQWYNARYENRRWLLDYGEYNLCTLTQQRIGQIVDRSIAYLRDILGVKDFTPLSFRAGNWLFQPTQPTAKVLAERGIKVDSSVFKGGLQHQHKLDYRRALGNGYYWTFTDHVDVPDSQGSLLEIPIHTQMIQTWKMLTAKRINLQQKGPSATRTGKERLYRLLDFMRFRHPLKFDFCRMTINELKRMIDSVINEDQQYPESFRPIVAIGHTKDLVDFETVESFLSYLEQKEIQVSTFEEIYNGNELREIRHKGLL